MPRYLIISEDEFANHCALGHAIVTRKKGLPHFKITANTDLEGLKKFIKQSIKKKEKNNV